MDRFLATETLIIELLLVVSLVALVVRRFRVPYTVALVVVGLLITFQQPLDFDLTPDLILALFVPPLLFEAAFHLEFRQLRAVLVPILVVAIPGVLLATLLVAGIVRWGVGLSFGSALVFGALISATDPVAVVALFRTLGVPKRLAVTVEGESLFNDGTAIVIFGLVLAVALPAGADGGQGSLNPLAAAIDFLRVSVGGLGIGARLGWLVARAIARIDDYLIETTLTTVLAFGAFLFAERFHVSGVLAVVAAGIVSGNIGPHGMSPTTKIVLFNFWEYLAFVANSLIFLLIGLDVNIPQLADARGPIAVGVLAVLASRALVVYGLAWALQGVAALRRSRRHVLRWAHRHVLFWGGLRGAISLALVLSLPAEFGDRELLRVMAFGVLLFTLLVQGITMGPLLRRLGLIERPATEVEYERRHGRLMALQVARDRLEQLLRDGMLTAPTWETLSQDLDAQVAGAREAQRELLDAHPALRAAEADDARREGLRAQRATLAALQSNGVISEAVYKELVTEIDAALDGEAPRPGEISPA